MRTLPPSSKPSLLLRLCSPTLQRRHQIWLSLLPDVAVLAADVVVAVLAVDVTVHGAKAAKPAAPTAQRTRRSHELLFTMHCLDALDKGASKSKILQDNTLDKKTLRGWIS